MVSEDVGVIRISVKYQTMLWHELMCDKRHLNGHLHTVSNRRYEGELFCDVYTPVARHTVTFIVTEAKGPFG